MAGLTCLPYTYRWPDHPFHRHSSWHPIPRHVLASAWFGCCRWCGYHHPQLVVVAPPTTWSSHPWLPAAAGDALGVAGGGQRHGALAGGQCGRRSIAQGIASWDHGWRRGTGTHGCGGQENDFCAFGIEVESRTKTRGTGVLEEEVASQRKMNMIFTEGWFPSEVSTWTWCQLRDDMRWDPNLWRWRMRRWPYVSWQLDQDFTSTYQWYMAHMALKTPCVRPTQYHQSRVPGPRRKLFEEGHEWALFLQLAAHSLGNSFVVTGATSRWWS